MAIYSEYFQYNSSTLSIPDKNSKVGFVIPIKIDRSKKIPVSFPPVLTRHFKNSAYIGNNMYTFLSYLYNISKKLNKQSCHSVE